MTNKEHIQAMNTVELAKYLFDRGNNTEYCYGVCAYQDDCEKECDEEFCITQICKWLEAERRSDELGTEGEE